MSVQTITITPVPSQRLFGTKSAAQYLGISPDTLRKYADLGWIKARRLEKRRVFALEDLDAFIERLPDYNSGLYTETGGKPGGKEVNHGS
jgi:excisionase family DNA binding protein